MSVRTEIRSAIQQPAALEIGWPESLIAELTAELGGLLEPRFVEAVVMGYVRGFLAGRPHTDADKAMRAAVRQASRSALAARVTCMAA